MVAAVWAFRAADWSCCATQRVAPEIVSKIMVVAVQPCFMLTHRQIGDHSLVLPGSAFMSNNCRKQVEQLAVAVTDCRANLECAALPAEAPESL